MNVFVNDVYLPYLQCEYRTQIYFGGSSSGKSFFLAQRCVLENLKGVNYLVVRNVAKTLRESTFAEIKKAISGMGLDGKYKINETNLTITCEKNGAQIIFRGLDGGAEKLKSITPMKGVIDRAWIEEATETSRNAYLQIKKRLRGISKHGAKQIIFSFNPVLREHWIYKEFFDGWSDSQKRLINDIKSISILKTTYRDNRFLAEDDIDSLENESDPYYYNVYTLGNFGILGNVIFKNWRIEDLHEQKKSFDHIYNGLDFGYTNPTAFIRVHVDMDRKQIFVLNEMYLRGASYESIAESVKAVIGCEYITCDNEDSRGIFMLNGMGINAMAAKKGPNSVLTGIKWLQGLPRLWPRACLPR